TGTWDPRLAPRPEDGPRCGVLQGGLRVHGVRRMRERVHGGYSVRRPVAGRQGVDGQLRPWDAGAYVRLRERLGDPQHLWRTPPGPWRMDPEGRRAGPGPRGRVLGRVRRELSETPGRGVGREDPERCAGEVPDSRDGRVVF